MPLHDMLTPIPKEPSGRNRWSFSHDQEHLTVLQAVTKQKGVALVRYIMDPINENDEQGWMLKHQQSHDDINAVLGLAGNDISSSDLKTNKGRETWAALHFREHLQWRTSLGI